jgi:NADH-quinone oxidoreductase subunit L
MDFLALYIVFLPLLASVFAGMFFRHGSHLTSQLITSGAVLTAAILSAIVFFDVTQNKLVYHVVLMPWIEVGSFAVNWAVYVDSLTAVMLVVVTSVSAIVHIYSIGYMHHDPHSPRFMAYLSLFTFFMLILVTADNFIQLFLGWEGVGLCSYLLIGFWYKKSSANSAAMKAFIVNRVGDVAFALGVFLIFYLFKTVSFAEIFRSVPEMQTATIEMFGRPWNGLTVACVLLFIGCMGKSAQFGLHTWLPDAMEGPTPVSALIHAATMVTAGVFLVARCSPLFEYAPAALGLVACVGAFTAVFAATVALTQNDIKKIIAYSTCSQLGYMFFACGVSAYPAAIFHLMTHAFFKALLFLGAGSVIHALSDEQDIRRMGGVARKIPVTYAYMWIGSLALAGVFPFAGYFSKDLILETSFMSGSNVGVLAYALGVFGAMLTAFYSWRLLILVFHGKSRADAHVLSHVHESPAVMLVPLAALALGAIAAGMVGAWKFGMVAPDLSFWNGAIVLLAQPNILEKAHHIPAFFKWLPSVLAVFGIAAAFFVYQRRSAIAEIAAKTFAPIYRFLLNKWYIDELYYHLFERTARLSGYLLWRWVDVRAIDGMGPNGAARLSMFFGGFVRRIQSGYISTYAIVMVMGVVALIAWAMRTYVR